MLTNRPEFKRRSSVHQPAYRTSYVAGKKTVNRSASGSPFHLVVLSAVLLVGSSFMLRLIATQHKAFLTTTGATLLAAESPPIFIGPKIDKARLEKEIGGLVRQNSSLNISVSYHDLTTKRTFHYGSHKSFVAASVSKVLTAALYLKHVDEQKRSLNDTVGGTTAQSALHSLIVFSDNAAWLAFDRVLGAGSLEAFAKDVGLTQYNHSQNVMSSDDAMTLLRHIYGGKLLSKSNTKLLLSYLKIANYRQYIVAALPSGVAAYHKVGFLGDRIHDIAIIDNGRFPYVLTIFTETKTGGFNFAAVTGLIHSITRSIHQSYK